MIKLIRQLGNCSLNGKEKNKTINRYFDRVLLIRVVPSRLAVAWRWEGGEKIRRLIKISHRCFAIGEHLHFLAAVLFLSHRPRPVLTLSHKLENKKRRTSAMNSLRIAHIRSRNANGTTRAIGMRRKIGRNKTDAEAVDLVLSFERRYSHFHFLFLPTETCTSSWVMATILSVVTLNVVGAYWRSVTSAKNEKTAKHSFISLLFFHHHHHQDLVVQAGEKGVSSNASARQEKHLKSLNTIHQYSCLIKKTCRREGGRKKEVRK